MLNLIKYEFIRKSKLLGVFLAVVLILDAVSLIRLQISDLAGEYQIAVLGTFFALLIWACFILYVVDVTVMYSRDLDNKTGYMFFMTPNSGFKILGSKVIAGILEGIMLAVIYLLLLVVNFMGFYGDILRAFISESDVFSVYLNSIHLQGYELIWSIVLCAITLFIGIVTFVLMIYAAISIRKSILANKKFGGLISFVFFLLLFWLSSKAAEPFTHAFVYNPITAAAPNYSSLLIQIVIQLVLGGIFFGLSGYLLDKRMDL